MRGKFRKRSPLASRQYQPQGASPGSIAPDRTTGASARRLIGRPGFSLPELLIVLAILTAMTAFALPTMRGPLDKSRLRSSATAVKSAIAKARATAIRRGCEVSFHYELGGSRWRIERVGSPFAPSAAINDVESQAVTSSNSENVSPTREIVREGDLPDGCIFIEETTATANQPHGASPGFADNGFDERTESDSFSQRDWADPIAFRPNGRSHDAQVLIRGSRDFAVKVSLRGLTGSISYSAPFRTAQTDFIEPLNGDVE